MTRVENEDSERVKKSNLLCFLCLLFITIVLVAIYLVFAKSSNSLGDPSDQFVVKNIPKLYTKLEGVEQEERDVFEGFRTSFIPPEEIVLSRREPKRNHSRKPRIADLVKINAERANRLRRTFIWNYYDELKEHQKKSDDLDEQNQNDEYGEDDYDGTLDHYDSSRSYEERDEMESVLHPQPHLDRGPLDDVMEQVRGQPELEEGETGSTIDIFKPVTAYTGIHAFWKGQGDSDTIRKTQANIMKQYMDMEADPCTDFYQYACGNWPSLNPIPADKAGYDTFEMLRENLDSVLKDLLEFKTDDQVAANFSTSALYLDENILTTTKSSVTKIDSSNLIDYYKPMLHFGSERIYLGNKELPNTKMESRGDKRFRRGSMSKTVNVNAHKTLKSIPENIKKIRTDIRQVTKRSDPFNSQSKENYTKNRYGISKGIKVGRHLQMYNRNRKRSIELISSASSEQSLHLDDPSGGDATIKARFLFKSCMDHDLLSKRGHQPLLDLIDILGGWPILNKNWNDKKFDWVDLVANLRLFNNDILISEWVGPDIKNSDEFVIQFDQTSLGLPTKEYFLQESNKVYLKAYEDYLIKIAVLLGGNTERVTKSASLLIALETRLANITSSSEDRRNVSELYQRMQLCKLESLIPEIGWRRYLSIVMNRTVEPDETVVIFALRYVKNLVLLIEETDPSTLANYLLWRFVRHRINNLDDRFQSAKQQFYFVLFGREQAPQRWKSCVSQVNSNMGMAVGSMFVQKYFDETSKNDTLEMTRDIQQAFRELLHKTDWIDDETKRLAGHKVDAMILRIGYPDFLLNKEELNERYKEVKIYPDKYFENILNILQHLTKMEQSRLGQPVDKKLWNTAPAVVNAYYSRNKNQIMFPAGILQPPFYHRHFPRSLNYGGIGVVIGHEITHGFDDKGRLFDCEGNLHRWWSDSAIEAFHTRSQCLIDQYSQYTVPEVHMKVDGVNTQGENIADNGGVKQAFRAYRHWLLKNGVEGETLPELNHTHTQLFFLNFAQVWCGAMRPEATRNKLKTAVHAPGRFRVLGSLSNSYDFAREFNCPPGSPMNPTEKCTVW